MQKQNKTSWAVARPITVLMLFFFIVITGVVSLQKVPLQMLPSGFTPPHLTVRVPYANANPADVEKKITKPIEEVVGTLQGVRRIRSRSSSSGSSVRIRFDGSVDMSVAYSQLQDRLERLRADLPEDVERYIIRKFNLQDIPILFIGISVTSGFSGDFQQWASKAELLEKVLSTRLEQEPGVAKVDFFGIYRQKIAIEPKRQLIQSHHINIFSLVEKLRQANKETAGGKIREGNQNYLVRSKGKFANLGEISYFPIANGINLKDVAKIEFSTDHDVFHVRVNGRPAIFLQLFKESTGNTVDICKRIDKIVKETFKKDSRFKMFTVLPLHDEGKLIRNGLTTLTDTLLWGAFFAVLILFFFLRSFSMTTLITFSIPLSLLLALIVIYFNNGSLNLLSLMGFTLGVGMLLDNAVVVVENIYRYLHQGKTPFHAAVAGVKEVSLAIVMATSTTLVVFLPIVLMNQDRTFRFFLKELGGAVCFSLLGSLFVALVFIPPALVYIEKRRKKSTKKPNFISAFCEKTITTSAHYYQKTLVWVLTHRFETIFYFLLPMVIATSMIQDKLASTDKGSGVERSIHIRLKFSDSHKTKKNSEQIFKMEQILLKNKQKLEIENILADCYQNGGNLHIWLTDFKDAKKNTIEIAKQIEKLLPKMPGVEIRGSWQKSSNKNQEGDIPIVIRGEDPKILRSLAAQIEKLLKEVKELQDVEAEEIKTTEEIHIELKRKQTQRYKVSPRIAAFTLAYALRGARISDFRDHNREIPIQFQYSKEGITNIGIIKNLKVYTLTGSEVALENIARIKIARAPATIYRYNRKNSYTIKATTKHDDLKKLNKVIDKKLRTIQLPKGYVLNKEGRFLDMQTSEKAFSFAMAMGVLLVFLLMGFLFESFLMPFSIILSIPFAYIGVYWTLYLSNTPLGMMCFLGIVVLAGVVVNNGIVLIDYINRLRKEGMDRTNAILTGAKARFRPIVMTSLTTLFGLLPMALGNADFVGQPYYPLGRTVIGGLAMSTVLTLIIVPVFYALFDDLRHVLLQISLNIFGKK